MSAVDHIKDNYGEIARTGQQACSAYLKDQTVEDYSQALGYSKEEIKDLPDDSNLALGCGNPTAIAGLKEGEVVIDLGSGSGFDCFIAAKKVGANGKVIGVDMTEDMIELARRNAQKGNYTNVEFHLGEIESLPVADGIADVIISNCVVNLSSNKEKVFKEAARVLKSGGRLAISDLVAIKKQPESFVIYDNGPNSWAYTSIQIDALKAIIESAGFKDVKINVQECSREYIANWIPESQVEEYIRSAAVSGIKI